MRKLVKLTHIYRGHHLVVHIPEFQRRKCCGRDLRPILLIVSLVSLQGLTSDLEQIVWSRQVAQRLAIHCPYASLGSWTTFGRHGA